MTVPPCPHAQEAHRSLVKCIAVGDGGALRSLYASLEVAASGEIRQVLHQPRDVQPVVYATFVEVWWLARFHVEDDADIATWVMAVATRRAIEQQRTAAASTLSPVGGDWAILAGLFRLKTPMLRSPAR